MLKRKTENQPQGEIIDYKFKIIDYKLKNPAMGFIPF
jgi:hypothetical protein